MSAHIRGGREYEGKWRVLGSVLPAVNSLQCILHWDGVTVRNMSD